MPAGQIFAIFDGARGEPTLSSLCGDLLASQRSSWPGLREGYEGLSAAKVRDIHGPGFSLKAQWNPRRIVSTAARLDPASIQARPCFLCRDNLPEAQRAIRCRRDYLVLCNPAPIFPQHYTIAHVHHRPQSIEPALADFLALLRDFSPDFTVFYNGPQSGASAPDHLHFQAAPAGILPVETDIRAGRRLLLQKEMEGVAIFKAVGMGRAILILKGMQKERVAAALLKVIAAMRVVLNAPGEPMMNLLGSYGEDGWRILVFPRRKHRPSVFDLEGEAQVLITPASVEMGGFLVTPREKDYHALDAQLAAAIFADVSVDEETLLQVVDAL
jgi:hypothetical protein